MIEWLKNIYYKYKSHASTIAFIAGFVWDSFTLTRIDLWLDNLILFSYILIAGFGIAVINLYEGEYLKNRFSAFLASWAPVVIQFAFGGLFSGYVIFYTKSASLVTSWPFLIFLAVLLVGNEFFEEKYRRLSFQISIFFIAIFSFTIFFIPVLLGTFGVAIFLLSGLVSLVAVRFFVWLLSRVIPERIEKSKRILVVSVGGIYLALNFFYFENIIPPIPLALTDAGVYHNVEKVSSDSYIGYRETEGWKDTLRIAKNFHYTLGQPIYVYSAVFAPTRLNTLIYHRWAYFDKSLGKWIETDHVQFPISGGRDGGYRGYSVKENITPGLWRVDVINKRNQLLGRIVFNVLEGPTVPVEAEML